MDTMKPEIEQLEQTLKKYDDEYEQQQKELDYSAQRKEKYSEEIDGVKSNILDLNDEILKL